jgi:two-component system, LuxR family, sensor kinase FixL
MGVGRITQPAEGQVQVGQQLAALRRRLVERVPGEPQQKVQLNADRYVGIPLQTIRNGMQWFRGACSVLGVNGRHRPLHRAVMGLPRRASTVPLWPHGGCRGNACARQRPTIRAQINEPCAVSRTSAGYFPPGGEYRRYCRSATSIVRRDQPQVGTTGTVCHNGQPIAMPERAFRPDEEAGRILAAILDASDDAIVATDLGGVISTWNPGAERIYGYSAKEMSGRSIGVLFPGDRRDDLASILRRIAAGARIEPGELVHVAKGGHRIQVLLSVSPVRDQDGVVIGASAIARDITAERRAEASHRSSEARARAIIETAVDAIILIDRRGRIEAFNPAAERLFLYRCDEVMGRNVSMLMPEPQSSEHDHYLRRYVMTGQRHIIGIGREVTALRKDGSTFPVHLSVAELAIEGETKFTGIIRDLTDRVKLEAKLREESGLVRLGELAAVLAHEVKNPLAAVSGAIQVLSDRLTSAEDREIAREVLRRLEALSAMMSDLLLYARPPKPRVRPVAVVELVESLIAFMRLDEGWRDVEAWVEGAAPSVLADAELLKVALQNLLVNAVQAMHGKGRLTVQLVEQDGLVHIDVVDSGSGILPDIQAQMFTPFFTTKSRGTGLGLATVRRIAEAHRGKVRILASDSGGTTVRFSLPAQQTQSVDLD